MTCYLGECFHYLSLLEHVLDDFCFAVENCMQRNGLKRINFKSQFLSCVHLIKAMVLNLWVMTLLEVK